MARTWAHANLHRIDTAFDERFRCFARRDVARDQLDVGKSVANRRGRSENGVRMTMRSVDDQRVDPRIDERACSRDVITARSDRRRDAQATELVLVRVGILTALVDVLDRDEAFEHTLAIHHGQLLDAVLPEDLLGLVERRAFVRRDQVAAGHRLAERPVELTLELQIAVGDDADELLVVVDDRHTGDAEALHECGGFAHGIVRSQRDRLENHAALRALHAVDLGSVAIDRHVLVQHADAARTGHGDRHLRFRNGVHRRGNERNAKLDAARERGSRWKRPLDA